MADTLHLTLSQDASEGLDLLQRQTGLSRTGGLNLLLAGLARERRNGDLLYAIAQALYLLKAGEYNAAEAKLKQATQLAEGS